MNGAGSLGQTDSYWICLQFLKHLGNQHSTTGRRNGKSNHPKDPLNPWTGYLAYILRKTGARCLEIELILFPISDRKIYFSTHFEAVSGCVVAIVYVACIDKQPPNSRQDSSTLRSRFPYSHHDKQSFLKLNLRPPQIVYIDIYLELL